MKKEEMIKKLQVLGGQITKQRIKGELLKIVNLGLLAEDSPKFLIARAIVRDYKSSGEKIRMLYNTATRQTVVVL